MFVTLKRFSVINWKIKSSRQIDESPDLTNKYHEVFVRFVNEDEIHENVFCCKELLQTSKGIQIFNILSSYLETSGLSYWYLYWWHLSISGSIRGFVCLIKEKNANIKTLFSSQRITDFSWRWVENVFNNATVVTISIVAVATLNKT